MTRKRFSLIYIFILLGLSGYSQVKRISGFVRDSISGEKLVGAYVITADNKKGTLTNSEGYFTIFPDRKDTYLLIKYIGYSTKPIDIHEFRDTTISFNLSRGYQLKEVRISAVKSDFTRFRNFAVTEIPVSQIKLSPAMLGEVDLLKTMQMLPGVNSTWAGFSGIVVRGGNPDQNLILVDDIPLYSYSHFYGLFSVINENALQSVRFMKGALPARYGGRLSSVVDITLKEGNSLTRKREIAIGLMSSSMLLDGPLKNGKTTYSLSARRSMIDLLVLPYNMIVNKQRAGYYFGDISGKITHNFSYKDKLTLSLFTSSDKYYNVAKALEYNENGTSGKLSRNEGYKWGNYILSAKWNKLITPLLSVNNSVYFSRFFLERHTFDKFTEGNNTYRSELSFSSRINDSGIRTDWQYTPSNSHRFYFGLNNTLHRFTPGVSVFYDKNIETGETISESSGDVPVDLFETVGYLEYDSRISKYISFNLGIRLTSLNSKNGNYLFPEPRLSGTITAIPNTNITLFYLKSNQYFHLLRSSILELPTDLWIPSTKNLPPETASQYGFEADYNINESYNISVATYHKEMNNLVEYKEGSSINSTKNGWEEKVETGTGTAYGTELFIHKKTGRFNGWVSYTLSWSKRKFEKINNGLEFYSSFDKRHELSVTTNYQISKKLKIGLNWVFNTGAPYNFPAYYVQPLRIVSQQGPPGSLVILPQSQIFESKNSLRLPPYHRLDLGVTYVKPVLKHPGRERTFSASLFNAYNRKNTYYKGEISGTVYNASLFGILPSVSYKLNF